LDPFWIGVVGTIIALVIMGKTVQTIRGQQKGRGMMMMYAIMAVMIIGVIWFIILRLMPAA
jgi:Na+/melibiose symporter-like transporter